MVEQVGSLTSEFGLLDFEIPPRDHVERAWQISKLSVNGRQQADESQPHLGEEIGMFVAAGDSHPLEVTVEPDVHVEVTGIFVEVENARDPREK